VEIVHQLGELFLAAVPTVIFVFLFYIFLRWSFFGPITRVMAERHARIEGARRYAESVRAAAQEKLRAYQETLRKTRTEIFTEQEAARRLALEERSAAIQKARSHANDEIQMAKKRIAAEIEAARGEIAASGQELAEQIVHAILEQRPLNPRPAGEAR
jgi:F0F1-type ATP synthase membrane subunit b/b'